MLTPAVLGQAQQRLSDGTEIADIAEQLTVKADTPLVPTNKSKRHQNDVQAAMGRGASNPLGRVAASRGLLKGVAPHFDTALDVPQAGVLFALPPGQSFLIKGVDGLGPCKKQSSLALRIAWRVGQPAGLGPYTGRQDTA